MGPITGPFRIISYDVAISNFDVLHLVPNNGPIAQTAMTPPLFCCTTMSAIVPPPMVTGAMPAIPARSLKAISMPILLETAHAMVKMMKKALETL